MASAMVKAGVPEGESIATANKKDNAMMGRADGGLVAHLLPSFDDIGAIRPLGPGEWVDNPDRSWSNELTTSVNDPRLNDGKATVIPTLWIRDGSPVRFDEDAATNAAITSRLQFPSFADSDAAQKFARQREENWQKINRENNASVAPLWERPTRARGGGVRDGKSLADHAYKLASKMARAQEKQAAPHFDQGGMPEIPYFERGEIRGVESAGTHPGGLLSGSGPGRTDTVPTSLKSGAYVLPADVISGLGQGNSAFGANVIQQMLHVGPYGTPLPAGGHRGGLGIPRPPSPFREENIQSIYPPHFARGGDAEEDEGKPVEVALAHGEFTIPPSWWTDGAHVYKGVKQLGGGDLDRGHRVLDRFLLAVRKKAVKETAALPGPKRPTEH